MRPPVDAAALMRGMFHSSEQPQPGIGVFPPDWLASDIVAAAVRRATVGQGLKALSLQYGEPAGDPALRRALSHKLAGLNVPAAPGQIVTTVGATHALDIVSRTLLRAGDHVMVEEPGWAIEFARLQALGAVILPVPRGADGPDLEVMARYCEAHAPKLFVSVSVLHNPTGHCLSPGSAHRVLTLANAHGFYIVEDDTYSHLAPDHATRLCALDGLQRTVYVSGFAKILAPGWRVGYLAAAGRAGRALPGHQAAGHADHAGAAGAGHGLVHRAGPAAPPCAARAHAAGPGARRSVKLARAAGCRFVSEPAGLFGWVDTGVDTEALSLRMLDEGYLLAPGALFHAGRKPGTLMRINFATTQAQAFWKVFERVRAVM
ncbi:MAG: PLP-dependent aminotransferase family protein [Pseudorhodoferax sp.]